MAKLYKIVQWPAQPFRRKYMAKFPQKFHPLSYRLHNSLLKRMEKALNNMIEYEFKKTINDLNPTIEFSKTPDVWVPFKFSDTEDDNIVNASMFAANYQALCWVSFQRFILYLDNNHASSVTGYTVYGSSPLGRAQAFVFIENNNITFVNYPFDNNNRYAGLSKELKKFTDNITHSIDLVCRGIWLGRCIGLSLKI